MGLEPDQPPRNRFSTPVLRVLITKQPLTGVFSAEVEETGTFAADTFRVEAALDQLPAGLDLTYWPDASNAEIEIIGGYEAANGNPSVASWLVGRVDDARIGWVHRTLCLTGRNLVGVLLDTKTDEQFSDQTSSQIVSTIAARHGLLTQITATTRRAGKLYQQFHCHLQKERSEWDLLVFLAEVEGFDLFIRGRTLYFQPPVDANSAPYVLSWSDQGPGSRVGNFEHLSSRRALTIADDVTVIASTWNQAQQKSFTATRKSSPVKGQKDAESSQIYRYVAVNLDQSQLDAYADARMAEITRHERVIEGVMPGDNALRTRMPLKLVGTGTSYDQNYYPETVHRSYSTDRGYGMEFRAKNQSPRNQISE